MKLDYNLHSFCIALCVLEMISAEGNNQILPIDTSRGEEVQLWSIFSHILIYNNFIFYTVVRYSMRIVQIVYLLFFIETAGLFRLQ